MRAMLITENLVEAAWKFTVSKSAAQAGANAAVADKTNKLSFHHKLVNTITVCTAMFFCMLVLQLLLCDSELGLLKEASRRMVLQQEQSGRQPLPPRAVHGMGTVFSRGLKGMTELIVAHMTEGVTDSELRIFVRTLYRSGALARADLVLLFPSNSLSNSAFHVVQDECDLGAKRLQGSPPLNVSVSNPVSSFNRAAFEEAAKEKNRSDLGAGSVMGFEIAELDPDNLLGPFVEDAPPQLRRWVCYQLLLGLLRRQYGTVLLARIGGVLILGDVLATLRKTNTAALFLLMESRSWDVPAAELQSEFHHRNKSKTPPKSRPRLVEAVYGAEAWRVLGDDVRRRKLISSGIMMGTMRAVRALSAAMVNEIIGVGLRDGGRLRRHRDAFPDEVVVSYMVHVSSVVARRVTDKVRVIENGRMSSFAYSVAGTNGTVMEVVGHVGAVDGLQEGRKYASFAEIVKRELCRLPDDVIVYSDCHQPFRSY